MTTHFRKLADELAEEAALIDQNAKEKEHEAKVVRSREEKLVNTIAEKDGVIEALRLDAQHSRSEVKMLRRQLQEAAVKKEPSSKETRKVLIENTNLRVSLRESEDGQTELREKYHQINKVHEKLRKTHADSGFRQAVVCNNLRKQHSDLSKKHATLCKNVDDERNKYQILWTRYEAVTSKNRDLLNVLEDLDERHADLWKVYEKQEKGHAMQSTPDADLRKHVAYLSNSREALEENCAYLSRTNGLLEVALDNMDSVNAQECLDLCTKLVGLQGRQQERIEHSFWLFLWMFCGCCRFMSRTGSLDTFERWMYSMCDAESHGTIIDIMSVGRSETVDEIDGALERLVPTVTSEYPHWVKQWFEQHGQSEASKDCVCCYCSTSF